MMTKSESEVQLINNAKTLYPLGIKRRDEEHQY